MPMDLVFVLKWIKVLLDACSLYSISLSYNDCKLEACMMLAEVRVNEHW